MTTEPLWLMDCGIALRKWVPLATHAEVQALARSIFEYFGCDLERSPTATVADFYSGDLFGGGGALKIHISPTNDHAICGAPDRGEPLGSFISSRPSMRCRRCSALIMDSVVGMGEGAKGQVILSFSLICETRDHD